MTPVSEAIESHPVSVLDHVIGLIRDLDARGPHQCLSIMGYSYTTAP